MTLTLVRKWTPLLVWTIAIVAIVLVPLSIIGHGYLPSDDALRHAAKAYSGKPWPDVLILADWVKMDHNPGWHAILGWVHRLTAAEPDGLVTFSTVALASLFFLAPLIWIRRPEVWLAVLAIVGIGITTILYRIHHGRPLVVSATVVMCLLFIWESPSANGRLWQRFACSSILIAAATWIHGGWYLFVLIPIALALSKEWISAKWMTLAWISGTLLGALITGHPWIYLAQSIEIVVRCFTEGIDQKYLAVEFQPSDGSPNICLIVGLVALWRYSSGAGIRVFNNPPFIFMAICWILGLRVMRFWIDWGLPALLVWLAIQIRHPWTIAVRSDSLERLGLTLGLAATVFFSMSSDTKSRWSAANTADIISSTDPATSGWFPDKGGTFYVTHMTQFYRLFYANPLGNWRYSTGFEPIFMPPDDLATFRQISRQPRAPESYEPWLRKLRPIDRIVMEQEEPIPLRDVEWHRFGQRTWFGRLRTGTNPAPQ